MKEIIVAKKQVRWQPFGQVIGRIFLKEKLDGPKQLIKRFEDLDKFFSDQPEAVNM